MNMFELLGLIGAIAGLSLGIYLGTSFGIFGIILGALIGSISGYIIGALTVFPIFLLISVLDFTENKLFTAFQTKRNKIPSIVKNESEK